MSNIRQFPIQPKVSSTSVDLDFVKWKMAEPNNLDAFVSQIIDLVEFEVQFPVSGPGIDKFEADLKNYLKEYFDNV